MLIQYFYKEDIRLELDHHDTILRLHMLSAKMAIIICIIMHKLSVMIIIIINIKSSIICIVMNGSAMMAIIIIAVIISIIMDGSSEMSLLNLFFIHSFLDMEMDMFANKSQNSQGISLLILHKND